MKKKTIDISGRTLSEVRSGLAVLKEKRLPSADAETMVASLWQMLRPAFEAYDEVVKKLQRLQQEAQECEDEDQKKQMFAELRDKADGLADQMFTVPLPKTKLQSQHLPKAHKGKDGDDNPSGNAAVMIALGPDFFEMPEPDTEEKLD